MTDKPATAQLLHAVAELWIRHMKQAWSDCAGNPAGKEILDEINSLTSLLETSKLECEPEEPMPSVLEEIDAYLKLHEADAGPCTIIVNEGHPITYLILSVKPFTMTTGEWLDEHYPGIISLQWQPGHSKRYPTSQG